MGVWSVTSSLDLGTGRHSNVYAVQTDPAGNVSPASAVYAVTVLPVTAAPTTFTSPAAYVFSISSGDINGDGSVDLRVSAQATGDALLQGDGAGSFVNLLHSMPIKLPNTVHNTAATGMVDFNGDGRMDVIKPAFTQPSHSGRRCLEPVVLCQPGWCDGLGQCGQWRRCLSAFQRIGL